MHMCVYRRVWGPEANLGNHSFHTSYPLVFETVSLRHWVPSLRTGLSLLCPAFVTWAPALELGSSCFMNFMSLAAVFEGSLP